jgi:zinc protease
LIQRDLDQMRTEDVSVEELHQAKALLLRQLPLGESSEDSVAAGLLRRAEIGLPLDESTRAAKRYYELTAAEVKAAFERQLRTGDFVQVVRGPASK